MRHTQWVRGALALVIGALALWKGVAAADVAPVDRGEAAAVRGESDAFLSLIPLGQVVPKMSCVSKSAKKPCNAQQGIFQTCTGNCPSGDMCVFAANSACTFCKTPAKSQIRECIKSAVFNCYSGTGNAVNCGPRFAGTMCTDFATTCLTGSTCNLDCKETKQQVGDCPQLNDTCTGNAP